MVIIAAWDDDKGPDTGCVDGWRVGLWVPLAFADQSCSSRMGSLELRFLPDPLAEAWAQEY